MLNKTPPFSAQFGKVWWSFCLLKTNIYNRSVKDAIYSRKYLNGNGTTVN